MYTDHYGLTGRPFQLTPDPAFYFDSATHRKAMTYLGYGLARGEGFIVITGDIGAGKTTLIGHLMATIDRARLTAVRLVSTQVEGDDMLRLTAQGFGLDTDGVAKAQLLDRIERFLNAQTREGRRTLLVVDEAQNLPVSALEELRMLSNFQAGGDSLLQIVLLGQPEFRDKLQKAASLEQLRQRVIATHHLDPMEPHEVCPYLEHRLTLVGWNGRPRFTEAACAALHAASGGVPRTINTLATRLLLHGAIETLDVIDADAVAAVTEDLGRDAGTPDAGPAIADDHALRARIVSLETAVADLADAPARAADDAAPATRIAALEAQVAEQDMVLRRVLTLLIDWAEDDGGQPNSAPFRRAALS
ncbi:MAG: XrtA/PEP-CTERM system-associated ATPase [Sphingomonas sp.]